MQRSQQINNGSINIDPYAHSYTVCFILTNTKSYTRHPSTDNAVIMDDNIYDSAVHEDDYDEYMYSDFDEFKKAFQALKQSKGKYAHNIL